MKQNAIFRIARTAVSFFTLLFIFLIINILQTSSPSILQLFALPAGESEKSVVTKVIDGDTIMLVSGKQVRLIGINAPEIDNPEYHAQCFGLDSKKGLTALLQNKEIILEKDTSDKDIYGRLLRYIYIAGKEGKKTFINEYMVKNGYAQVNIYPPDVKYQKELLTAQKIAQKNNIGLWGKCKNEYKKIPSVYPTTTQLPPKNCRIKGNINFTTGKKIYHLPGCEYYNQTYINEKKGEKWFCSEREAQKAGWVKAGNCP